MIERIYQEASPALQRWLTQHADDVKKVVARVRRPAYGSGMKTTTATAEAPPGFVPVPGSTQGGWRQPQPNGDFRYWYPDTPDITPPWPRREYHALSDPRVFRNGPIKDQLTRWGVRLTPTTSAYKERNGKYEIPEHHVADVFALLAAPTPPAGYVPIPESKQGGWRQPQPGGGFRYWYPDDPNTGWASPRPDDREAVAALDASVAPTSTLPNNLAKALAVEERYGETLEGAYSLIQALGETPYGFVLRRGDRYPLTATPEGSKRAGLLQRSGALASRFRAGQYYWPSPDAAKLHAMISEIAQARIRDGQDAYPAAVDSQTPSPEAAPPATDRVIQVGAARREHLSRVGEFVREGGQLFVITSVDRVHRTEDGRSFNFDFDDGWLAQARVRPATAAEEVDVAQKMAERAAAKAVAQNIAAAWRAFATSPKEHVAPSATAKQVAGGQRYDATQLLVDGDHFYLLTYNGRDGDDWSASNYGNFVSMRGHLTPELRQALGVLVA